MVVAEPRAFFIILIATLAISLFSTIVYKFATDQKKMRAIKDRLKELQQQLKGARGDQEKMLKLNAEIMSKHNEYSMQSMRSLLFTFLPVLLVFFYLQGTVAFDPIQPGEGFSVILDYRNQSWVGETNVTLPPGFELINRTPYNKSGFLGFGSVRGEELSLQAPPETGEYQIGLTAEETVNRTILVTDDERYARQTQTYSGPIKSASVSYDGLRILNISWAPRWLQGWLAVYIIFTLILTNVFRRLFKVV